MKTYTFAVTIKEGNDEFWESIGEGRSGCDEVLDLLTLMLADYGFHRDNSSVVLVQYEEDLK